MRGEAFCPAHVTGFFKAELENELGYLGSLGAGFSIQDGVTTTVSVREKNNQNDRFRLEISGYQPDNTLVSEYVIEEFLKLIEEKYFLEVFHDIKVPVGFGLGCSGAVALSLAIALNRALNTKLTKTQVGRIAHMAEIQCKTGLGDVLAAYHGGFEIRTKSGAPGVGLVEKIRVDSPKVIMICFSPISTKNFLKEKLPSINGLGGKMVKKLIESKNYNLFQDMSVEFANYVSILTPKMASVIKELHKHGIKCGVAMFGETIFTLIPSSLEKKVMGILEKYPDAIIIKSKIDNKGARLVQ